MNVEYSYDTTIKVKVDVTDEFLSNMKEQALNGLKEENTEYHYYERNMLILLTYIEKLKNQKHGEPWYDGERYPPKDTPVLCEYKYGEGVKEKIGYNVFKYNGYHWTFVDNGVQVLKSPVSIRRWKCF